MGSPFTLEVKNQLDISKQGKFLYFKIKVIQLKIGKIINFVMFRRETRNYIHSVPSNFFCHILSRDIYLQHFTFRHLLQLLHDCYVRLLTLCEYSCRCGRTFSKHRLDYVMYRAGLSLACHQCTSRINFHLVLMQIPFSLRYSKF